ncbi:MAG: hypothetical protein FD168_336 [Desulfobulbaceae bacterium]|nr:MAG: hypothetical protein FD168_336 [Desulfobulbaceae bacterium]
MDYLIIALCAFLASGLTLYSGFGLGTLLLPVFAFFFPVEVAVGATALVHGANNILKVAVVGRHADKDLAFRFGIPAIVAAFAGALSSAVSLISVSYTAIPSAHELPLSPRLN